MRLSGTIAHVRNCEFIDTYNLRVNPHSGAFEGSSAVRVSGGVGYQFVNCLFAGNFAGRAGGMLSTAPCHSAGSWRLGSGGWFSATRHCCPAHDDSASAQSLSRALRAGSAPRQKFSSSDGSASRS